MFLRSIIEENKFLGISIGIVLLLYILGFIFPWLGLIVIFVMIFLVFYENIDRIPFFIKIILSLILSDICLVLIFLVSTYILLPNFARIEISLIVLIIWMSYILKNGRLFRKSLYNIAEKWIYFLMPFLIVVVYLLILKVIVIPRYLTPDECFYIALAEFIIQGKNPAGFASFNSSIKALLLGRLFWILNVGIGKLFGFYFFANSLALFIIYFAILFFLDKIGIRNGTIILAGVVGLFLPNIFTMYFLLLPDLFFSALFLSVIAFHTYFVENISKLEKMKYINKAEPKILLNLFLLLLLVLLVLLVKFNELIVLIVYLMLIKDFRGLVKIRSNKLMIIIYKALILIPILYELIIDIPIAVMRYVLYVNYPSILDSVRIITIGGFLVAMFSGTNYTSQIYSKSVVTFLEEFYLFLSPGRLLFIPYVIFFLAIIPIIANKRNNNEIRFNLLIDFYVIIVIYVFGGVIYFAITLSKAYGWDEARNFIFGDILLYIISIWYFRRDFLLDFKMKLLAGLTGFLGAIVVPFLYSDLSGIVSMIPLEGTYIFVAPFIIFLILLLVFILSYRIVFGNLSIRVLRIKRIFKWNFNIIVIVLFMISLLINSLYMLNRPIVWNDYGIQKAQEFVAKRNKTIIVTNIYQLYMRYEKGSYILAMPINKTEFESLLSIPFRINFIIHRDPVPAWAYYLLGNYWNLSSMENRLEHIRNLSEDIIVYELGGYDLKLSTITRVKKIWISPIDIMSSKINILLCTKKESSIFIILSGYWGSKIIVISKAFGNISVSYFVDVFLSVNKHKLFFSYLFMRYIRLVILDNTGLVYDGIINGNFNEIGFELKIYLFLVLVLVLIFILWILRYIRISGFNNFKACYEV